MVRLRIRVRVIDLGFLVNQHVLACPVFGNTCKSNQLVPP